MPSQPSHATQKDEFFVGYLEKSPPGIAVWCRRAVSLVFGLGLLLSALLVMAQARFDRGAFEFGVESVVQGLLVERPFPLLLVPGEGSDGMTTHYLVDVGKWGSAESVAGFDGALVRVTGSLIYNDHQRMVEVQKVESLDLGRLTESETEALRRLQQEPELDLGRHTLVGEIVDSKCYFGVMKPGRTKPHRACAIRCISGGIPAALRVEDHAGKVDVFLLVRPDGSSLGPDLLDRVAEPVEVTGDVIRSGARLMLKAPQSSFRRLP